MDKTGPHNGASQRGGSMAKHKKREREREIERRRRRRKKRMKLRSKGLLPSPEEKKSD